MGPPASLVDRAVALSNATYVIYFCVNAFFILLLFNFIIILTF